jgi:beta-lactamase regulating signal transducer with metallopeptidase domain
MISSETIAWPSLLLMQLLTIAGRALVLAAGAGLGLTVFRVKSTSLRLFAWSAVLYGVAAVSLMAWMLPAISVPVPSFIQESVARPDAPAPRANVVEFSAREPIAARTQVEGAAVNNETRETVPSGSSAEETHTRLALSTLLSLPWETAASAVYLAIAGLLLMRIFVGMAFTYRLMRASQTIHDSRIGKLLKFHAQSYRHVKVPRMAESDFISVPVTVGMLRSSILLPVGWREWDDAKLETVIAHEMSHVVRHDALTQLVSLLHRAAFWFSPMAWWLDRHLRDLAEQASDEAALSAGANRNEYARTLLGFFEALQAAPQRVWWQGVAMAESGRAEQRVERILAWRGVTMGLKKSVAMAIIACAVPVVYLAASVRPARAHDAAMVAAEGQEPAPPPEPNAVPAKPPAGAATTVVPPTVGSTAAPVVPAGPPGPDTTPVVEVEPHERDHSYHGHNYSYSYGYDDEERFVIVSGKTDAFTMSGSAQDARHVEKLKKSIPGDFIWFQRDEKSYIIRDQATVERARKLWAPQQELGSKQEELGKQQEALGKQQEELGARMERVQVKVPDMTAELDKLRAELKALSSGATAEQVGRIQSEIGELQSKIGEVQSSAGDQQSKIGEEMAALGEKQGKLGEQQGELGRRQGELAEQATRQMKELLDEAIKKGTAQPEPPSSGEGTL